MLKVLFVHEDEELCLCTAADACLFKPSLLQRVYESGEIKLNRRRVKELIPDIDNILHTIAGAICITADNYIISGHHRQAALKEAISSKRVDPESPVLILRNRSACGRNKVGQIATVRANDTQSCTTKEQVFKIHCGVNTNLTNSVSNSGISCIKSLDIKDVKTRRACLDAVHYISRSIAAYVATNFISNSEWSLEESIKSLSAQSLYSCHKIRTESMLKAIETNSVNNVGMLDNIASHCAQGMVPFIYIMNQLYTNGLWKQLFGKTDTLRYSIFEVCFHNPKLTNKQLDKIVRNITKNSGAITDCIRKQFLHNTEMATEYLRSTILKDV